MPKLKLPGLTARVGAVSVVPVPLRPIATAGLVDELLETASLPVIAPAVVGLNCTVSVTVCFGFMVTGKLAPETVKPAPLMAAAVTRTGAVPVEARVRARVDEEPTVTLPKLKLAGFTVSVGVVSVVPVPVSPTAAMLLAEELE